MSSVSTYELLQEDVDADLMGRKEETVSPAGSALDALATEFDSLHALVYRYLLHRFFDPELAQELTAQTFYQAAVFVRSRGDKVTQLRHWLLRTATNLANTHLRKMRLRRFFLTRAATPWATSTDPHNASQLTDHARVARVRGAVLALRPKYQAAVVMRYYCQMSYADIAAAVGCREAAVRARLSRAIKEMRERLDCKCPQGEKTR